PARSRPEGQVMARRLAVSMLSLAAIVIASRAGAADNEQVQQAIDRGIAHLKGLQNGDGSWPTHRDGSTALAALALLECDVPASDPAIQNAARFLRGAWTNIDEGHATYCLALMILFFDRLGEPDDVPIIQALAVR